MSKRAIQGYKWSALDRLAVQIIQLLVIVLLARMVGPEVVGLIGLAMIVVGIGNVISDSGMSIALIRNVNRTDADLCTAFICNLVIATVVSVIVIFSSEYISDYYGHDALSTVLKVLTLVVVINSLAIVPRALMSIKLDFKRQAFANVIAAIISGAIAIYMAHGGAGIWALVSLYLIYSIVTSAILFLVSPWRPKFVFDCESAKEMIGFGFPILLSGILDTVFRNIYQLIIGKVYPLTEVGYFNQAKQLSEYPATTFTSIIQRVNFSSMAAVQTDKELLYEGYSSAIKITAITTFPLMALLSIQSEYIVYTILGADWMQCAAYLKVLAISYALYPIHAINLNYLQVKGKSVLFLKLEIIKKMALVAAIAIALPFGIVALCWSLVGVTLLSWWFNSYYPGKDLGLGFLTQIKITTPALLGCALMIIFVNLTGLLKFHALIQLVVVSIAAIAFYGVIIRIFAKSDARLIYKALKIMAGKS